MNISVIVAHPNPKSFNHALAEAAVTELQRHGHSVSYHDLHAEKFDPLLPPEEIPMKAAVPPEIAAHCREIVEADGIIVVHPNWWSQAPAILKGWLDRVLRPGVAYKFGTGPNGEGIIIGLLRAKAAVVFVTSNTPPDKEVTLYGDPTDAWWKRCVWGFCGVKTVHRELISPVITSTLEQRQAWLQRSREIVASQFPD
ncbi:MAG: NAD(P)H-dependent oxidoreductase [Verrucomicrobia bacterium]|nr:NAD(P)H-dependent oxidoreductase [Verrucomicrobiota bacterium]